MSTPYRLATDTLGRAEIEAAKVVLDSGRLTMGERVRAFEVEFASVVGARHAVMVNSGSSANLVMVDTLLRRSTEDGPLSPGDEVIVPALSWPTTVWPLVQLGLVPVFVDVDPVTLAIDLDSAREALGPRTKGMFLIHVLGRTANMGAFQSFCREHGLSLLEDVCESLGAHWGEQHAGTFGAAGSFSFYFSHHISTIEGGMVVTNDPRLCDDVRSLRAHGWARDRSDKGDWAERYPGIDERFLFITPGYNVRPTELQGAIGSVQLARLETMLRAREELASKVAGWLARRVPWLELIGSETLQAGAPTSRLMRSHSWMTLPLRLRDGARVTRREVVDRLEQQGVETRPIIAGNLARHPAALRCSHRSAASLRQSDLLLERGFMIGCHPVLAPGALETLERAISSLSELA
jgi:CDP-6-deoxy-D-xylo-4-hexulose-3-dehydrase